MTTAKISELSAATALTGNELVELSQLAALVLGSVQSTTEAVSYAGAAYGSFYDVTDQTGSTSAATGVIFGTNDINTKGVTVVSNTRITFAEAGVYQIAYSLQLANSDTSDRNVTIWLAKSGANIAASSSIANVPKASDGGSTHFQNAAFVTVTAGQYVEVKWLPAHVAVTLDFTAAGAIAPSSPSAFVITQRIDL